MVKGHFGKFITVTYLNDVELDAKILDMSYPF